MGAQIVRHTNERAFPYTPEEHDRSQGDPRLAEWERMQLMSSRTSSHTYSGAGTPTWERVNSYDECVVASRVLKEVRELDRARLALRPEVARRARGPVGCPRRAPALPLKPAAPHVPICAAANPMHAQATREARISEAPMHEQFCCRQQRSLR